MSIEQVLKEHPWLRSDVNAAKIASPYQHGSKVGSVTISRISLELLLAKETDEFDEDGRIGAYIHYDFIDAMGKPIEIPGNRNRNLFRQFMSCEKEDRERLTYILQTSYRRLPNKSSIANFVLYKPPLNYPSVRQFVREYGSQINPIN